MGCNPLIESPLILTSCNIQVGAQAPLGFPMTRPWPLGFSKRGRPERLGFIARCFGRDLQEKPWKFECPFLRCRTQMLHVRYIYLLTYHKNQPNAGKYTIHGAYMGKKTFGDDAVVVKSDAHKKKRLKFSPWNLQDYDFQVQPYLL